MPVIIEDDPILTSPWGRVRIAVPAGWSMVKNNLFDLDPATAEVEDFEEVLLHARRFPQPKPEEALDHFPAHAADDIRMTVHWFPKEDRRGLYHMHLQHPRGEAWFVGRNLRVIRAEVERWLHDPDAPINPMEGLERTWFDGQVWVRGGRLKDIPRGPYNTDPRTITEAFRQRARDEVAAYRADPTLENLLPMYRTWMGSVISDEVEETDPWERVRDGTWALAQREDVKAVIISMMDHACEQGLRLGSLALGVMLYDMGMQIYEIRGMRPAVLAVDAEKILLVLRI